jgi:hypothetical protein
MTTQDQTTRFPHLLQIAVVARALRGDVPQRSGASGRHVGSLARDLLGRYRHRNAGQTLDARHQIHVAGQALGQRVALRARHHDAGHARMRKVKKLCRQSAFQAGHAARALHPVRVAGNHLALQLRAASPRAHRRDRGQERRRLVVQVRLLFPVALPASLTMVRTSVE